MSMRYADISGPTLADGSIPAVPSIPLDRFGGTSQVSRAVTDDDEFVRQPEDIEQAREEARKADLQAIEEDGFDPDSCKLWWFSNLPFICELMHNQS